jgi:hypothetical protein
MVRRISPRSACSLRWSAWIAAAISV